MTPRHVLLRRPHMAHLIDNPALTAMSDDEIAVLERFMEFCAAHSLDDPSEADIAAFAQLRSQTTDALEALATALHALDVPGDFLVEIRKTVRRVQHRDEFRGVPKELRRSCERTVTLPLEALPQTWQDTLRRLRLNKTFAESILDRMERRLGAFAWSARAAGLPIDISSIAAHRALYKDLRERSIAMQKKRSEKLGLTIAKDDEIPRWAYLRSSWEELARFAQAHGCDDETYDHLAATRDELAELERLQDAQKLSKAMQAGTASGLLAEAGRLLETAEKRSTASLCHAGRNRAAAIALGIAIPARPIDVFEQHRFGIGLFYEPQHGTYYFKYRPKKTRRLKPRPLHIRLNKHWNRFIDALILQDQDPRYLGELRAQAFAEQRPLYVNYDGSHCTYSYYSRQWATVTNTGGHIARTLIWDEMSEHGAFGIEYASRANQHGAAMREVYSTEAASRAAYNKAQEVIIAHGAVDDDISDLL